MMNDNEIKQVVFPRPTTCTHVYADGSEERVRYGQYEGIKIISENGWPIQRLSKVFLNVPIPYWVSEVVKEDGTKVIFDEPFYCIEKKEYSDGRLAKRL